MARESHAMFRCHPVRYALVIIFLSTAVAVICTLSIRYGPFKCFVAAVVSIVSSRGCVWP